MDSILQDAVAPRMAVDVPVGTLLSGGIDSTFVTVIAQKNSAVPINTYSIGFYDEGRNEAPFSSEIARYLGTNHHEHYMTEQDIFDMITDLPQYYDEPFADSPQLPTMFREWNIKKVLPSEIRAFINNREQHTKTQLYIDVVKEETDKILGRKSDNVKFEHEKYLHMCN